MKKSVQVHTFIDMSDKVDISLDAIIAATKGKGGRRGGSGRGGGAGGSRRGTGPSRGGRLRTRGRSEGAHRINPLSSKNGASAGGHSIPDGQWDHTTNNTIRSSVAGRMSRGTGGLITSGPGKLLVSNLDLGVSESDIHELFSEFGSLNLATIHYDRSGRSRGTAEVCFDRRSNAIKAMKQYNGVPLDGRPMRIEIAASDREITATSQPQRRVGVTSGRVGRPRIGSSLGPRPSTTRGRGSMGVRGEVRGGRGGGRKKKEPVKSKEDLDAEMDAYMNTKDASVSL